MKTFSRVLACATAITLHLSSPASAAEVKVFAAGGMTSLMRVLAPAFEKAGDHQISAKFVLSPAVKEEIDKGELFDLVVGTPAQVDALIRDGKVLPDTRTHVGRTGIGIVVRPGAQKPNIGTVEAFKTAMLSASSVTHATGFVGMHLEKVFQQLGIADQMKAKTRFQQAGGAITQAVARGEAEIGIGVVSNIVTEPGAEYAGALPGEIQSYLTFDAAVSAQAKNPEGAKAFSKFLDAPHARALLEANGLERSR
jgi:molybdate transport system substrate-binding protein